MATPYPSVGRTRARNIEEQSLLASAGTSDVPLQLPPQPSGLNIEERPYFPQVLQRGHEPLGEPVSIPTMPLGPMQDIMAPGMFSHGFTTEDLPLLADIPKHPITPYSDIPRMISGEGSNWDIAGAAMDMLDVVPGLGLLKTTIGQLPPLLKALPMGMFSRNVINIGKDIDPGHAKKIINNVDTFSKRLADEFSKGGEPVRAYTNPLDPKMTMLAKTDGDIVFGFDIDFDYMKKLYSEGDADWYVSTISSLKQNKGYANKFMKALTKMADEDNMAIRLFAEPIGDPSQTGGMTQKQLVNFYKKFGFEFDEFNEGIRQPLSGTKYTDAMRDYPWQWIDETKNVLPVKDAENYLDNLKGVLDVYDDDIASPTDIKNIIDQFQKIRINPVRGVEMVDNNGIITDIEMIEDFITDLSFYEGGYNKNNFYALKEFVDDLELDIDFIDAVR